MRRFVLTGALIVAATVQTWTAIDYLTEGGDAARTGWLRNERSFTTANVSSLKLLWTATIDTPPREMHHLFPPLIIERIAVSGRERELAVVAGVSDDLFGVDASTGQVLWK